MEISRKLSISIENYTIIIAPHIKNIKTGYGTIGTVKS